MPAVGGRESAPPARPAAIDRSPQRGAVVGGDTSAGPLQRLLPRLELLDDEAARSVAEVLLRWRQGEVHGSLVAPSIDACRGTTVGQARPPVRARSLRIRPAASLPGAPITQPPGWVPEPHW